MTGELADTFESRAEGVRALTDTALRELGPAPLMLYAGRAGFVAPQTCGDHVADIASANWHATASLVGTVERTALVMDMGSTTTDIVPVVAGEVAARGYTDAERLASGELVYTGLVRSFLMTANGRAPFAGCWSDLIRENFANMADVHRILGRLPEGADQMTTADGRDKTIEASRARLARMVGRDIDDADAAAWAQLARWFAETQVRAVTDGAMLVLSHRPLPEEAPVVMAGAGAGVLREVARRIGRRVVDFEGLVDVASPVRAAASVSAPAAAVALLALRQVQAEKR
jgi:probable H4MPT-linked C1 transfer pathway protein